MKMNNEFEVTSPLWVKIFVGIGYFGTCVAIAFDATYSVQNLLNPLDVIGMIAFFCFFFIFPLLLLVIFFTKTVFTDTEIIHTTFILMRTRKSYEEIDGFEVTKHSDIRVRFRGGSSIKVLTGEDNLGKTLKVLKNRAGFNVTR